MFHIEFSRNGDCVFVHIVDEEGCIYLSGKDESSFYTAFVNALNEDRGYTDIRALYQEAYEKRIIPNPEFYECAGCFKKFYYPADERESSEETVVEEGWLIGSEDAALCYSCQSHRLGGGGSITALSPQSLDPDFQERISKAMKKLESTLEL